MICLAVFRNILHFCSSAASVLSLDMPNCATNPPSTALFLATSSKTLVLRVAGPRRLGRVVRIRDRRRHFFSTELFVLPPQFVIGVGEGET
jgi:hypothetical protein